MPVHKLPPLHAAAMQISRGMIGFLIEECGVPVDTVTENLALTPLHVACFLDVFKPESQFIPLVRYLVEEKGRHDIKN